MHKCRFCGGCDQSKTHQRLCRKFVMLLHNSRLMRRENTIQSVQQAMIFIFLGPCTPLKQDESRELHISHQWPVTSGQLKRGYDSSSLSLNW